MGVERISEEALRQLVKGGITEQATCVIKFYSNGCHYCHALQKDYKTLSDQYRDIHFFAFNTDDITQQVLDDILLFKGVPTICVVNTGPQTQVALLPEPEHPDADQYYTALWIKNFIDKEARQNKFSPAPTPRASRTRKARKKPAATNHASKISAKSLSETGKRISGPKIASTDEPDPAAWNPLEHRRK